MCHPDPPAVIVVSDSDQEDCGGSQSDTSIVSLVDGIAGILGTAKASGSTGPTTDIGIRQRPTKNQRHEVIMIDCDEGSSHSQPKRGRSVTDLVTPSPVKSDGGSRYGGLENKPLVSFQVILHLFGTNLNNFAVKAG
jgi:hypothetical protein